MPPLAPRGGRPYSLKSEQTMAIQDPPEMGMEKRLLLAMVLSMAILFLVPYFTGAPPPLPAPEPAFEVEELDPPAVSRELPR